MTLAVITSTGAFAQSDLVKSLAGNWQLMASPFEGGVDNIAFTATLSTDGTYLSCHADAFITRASQAYSMDWKMLIEEDGDKIRLGWVLDDQNPSSTMEFQEASNKYTMGGANADGSHRYIYLLSENIATQQLEAMTLYSGWQTTSNAPFTLPQTQQIYGVVSKNQPYNGAIGYVDIWASIKLQKVNTSGIHDLLSTQSDTQQTVYNLQGVRQNSLKKGINIVNGRKIIVR